MTKTKENSFLTLMTSKMQVHYYLKENATFKVLMKFKYATQRMN